MTKAIVTPTSQPADKKIQRTQDDAEQRQPTRAPRDAEGHNLAVTTCLSRFGETKSDEIARYEKQGHSPDEQQERAHRYRSSLSAEPHSKGHRIMDSPMDACERRRCYRNPKSEKRASSGMRSCVYSLSCFVNQLHK